MHQLERPLFRRGDKEEKEELKSIDLLILNLE